MTGLSDPYGLYRPAPRAPLNPAEVERMLREMRDRVAERIQLEDAQFYTSMQSQGLLQQDQQAQLQQMRGQALEQQSAQLQMDMMLQDVRIPAVRSGMDQRIQELAGDQTVPQEQRARMVADISRTLGSQGLFRQGFEEDVSFGRQELKRILEQEAGLTGSVDAFRSGLAGGLTWDSAESSTERVMRLLQESIEGQVSTRVGREIGFPGMRYEAPQSRMTDLTQGQGFPGFVQGVRERTSPEQVRLFGRTYEPEHYASAVLESVLRQAREEGVEVPESTIKELAGGAGTIVGMAPSLMPLRSGGQALGQWGAKLIGAGKWVTRAFKGLGAFAATTGAVAARGPNTAQRRVIENLPEEQREAAATAAGIYNGLTFGFFMPAWGVGASLGRTVGKKIGGRLVGGLGALAGESATFPIAAGTSQLALETIRDKIAAAAEGVNPKELSGLTNLALLTYQTNPVYQDSIHKLLQDRSLDGFIEAAKTYAGEVGQGMVAFGILKLLGMRPDLTTPTDRTSAQAIVAKIEELAAQAKTEVGEFVADQKLEGEEANAVRAALEGLIDGDADAIRPQIPEGTALQQLIEMKGEGPAQKVVAEEAIVERVVGEQKPAEQTEPLSKLALHARGESEREDIPEQSRREWASLAANIETVGGKASEQVDQQLRSRFASLRSKIGSEVPAEPAPRTVKATRQKLAEQKKAAEAEIATKATPEAMAQRDEAVARDKALSLLEKAETAKGARRTKLLLQAEERLAEAEKAAGRETEMSPARALIEEARQARGAERVKLIERARETLAATEIARRTEGQERAATVALGEPAREAERREQEVTEANKKIAAGEPDPIRGQKVELSPSVKGTVEARPSESSVAIRPEPVEGDATQQIVSGPTIVAPVSSTRRVTAAAPALVETSKAGGKQVVGRSADLAPVAASPAASPEKQRALDLAGAWVESAQAAKPKKKGGRPRGKTIKFSEMVAKDREQNTPDLPDHSVSTPDAEAIRKEMSASEAEIAKDLGKQMELPYAAHSLAKSALESGVPLHEGKLAEGVKPDASHPRYAEGAMNPGTDPRAVWNAANLETAYASVAKIVGRNGKLEKALKDLLTRGEPEAMLSLADELRGSTDPAVRSLADSFKRNLDFVTGKKWAANRMAAELTYRWLVDLTGQAKPETSLGDLVAELRGRVQDARDAFLESKDSPEPRPQILLQALIRLQDELAGPLGTALRGYEAGRKLLSEIQAAQKLPSQVGALSIGDIVDHIARGYMRLEAWSAGRVMNKAILPHNEQFARPPERTQPLRDKALLVFQTPRNHMGKLGEKMHQGATRAEQDAGGVAKRFVAILDKYGIRGYDVNRLYTTGLEMDPAARTSLPQNVQDAIRDTEPIFKSLRRQILRSDKRVIAAYQSITRKHRRARFLAEEAKKLRQKGEPGEPNKPAEFLEKQALSLMEAAKKEGDRIGDYIANWGRENYATATKRRDIEVLEARIEDILTKARKVVEAAKGRPQTAREKRAVGRAVKRIRKFRRLLARAKAGERIGGLEMWFAAPHVGRWERWGRDNLVSHQDLTAETELSLDPGRMGSRRSRFQRMRMDRIPEKERDMDPRKWFSRYSRSVIPVATINEAVFAADAEINGEMRPVGYAEMFSGDRTHRRIYIHRGQQYRNLGKVWVHKDGSFEPAGKGEKPEGAKERIALWSIADTEPPPWSGVRDGGYAKNKISSGSLVLQSSFRLLGNLERRYGGLLAEVGEANEQTLDAARRQQWDRLFKKMGVVLERTNMTHVEGRIRGSLRTLGRAIGTTTMGLLSPAAAAGIGFYGIVQNAAMLGPHAFARASVDLVPLIRRMRARWKEHRASMPMEMLDKPLYEDWAGQTSMVRGYAQKLRTPTERVFEHEVLNDMFEDVMSMPVMTHRIHRMFKAMNGDQTWFGRKLDQADAVSWAGISFADWMNRAHLSLGIYRQAYTHARLNLDMPRDKARHYAQFHTWAGVTSEHGNYVETANSEFDDMAIAPVAGLLERWTRNYTGVLLRSGRYAPRYMATVIAAVYLMREMGAGDLIAGLGVPWRNLPGGEELDMKFRQLVPEKEVEIAGVKIQSEALPFLRYLPAPVPTFSNPGTEPFATMVQGVGKLLSGNMEGFKKDADRAISNAIQPRVWRDMVKAFGTEEVDRGNGKQYRYQPWRLFGTGDRTSIYYKTHGLDMVMQQTVPGTMLEEADHYNAAATARALSEQRKGERASLRMDTVDVVRGLQSQDQEDVQAAREELPRLAQRHLESGLPFGTEQVKAAIVTAKKERELSTLGRSILYSVDNLARLRALTRGMRDGDLGQTDLEALLVNPLTRVQGRQSIGRWLVETTKLSPNDAVEFVEALRAYKQGSQK